MTQLCEVEYVDKKAGLTRACINGTPATAAKRLDGLWWCKDCLRELHKALKKRGVGYFNRTQAMARIGKEGDGKW